MTNNRIKELLKQRILLMDGGMGTMLQQAGLVAADYGLEKYVGCNEYLVESMPHLIGQIHREYLAAGADIIETNTFGATPLVLAEYGLERQAEVLNTLAAKLARKAACDFSSAEKPRFVAGSMGPTTKSLSVTGGISFEQLAGNYKVQAQGLIKGGADFLLLETAMDTLNLKAGLVGINQAFEAIGLTLPIAVSVTIEANGAMLAGQNIEALYASLQHVDLLFLGLNCALGPDLMQEHIRDLANISRFPTFLMPNAGIPDEEGIYQLSPEKFAGIIDGYIEQKWVNLIGGCCGTTPAHIQALAQLATIKQAQCVRPFGEQGIANATLVSGIELLSIEEDQRPYFVGERTNVIGSRIFKELIAAEKFEEASEIARKQLQNGASIIDVCLANPDRNEREDLVRFLDFTLKKVKAPLMLDCQDPQALLVALQKLQGKCILNSVNLEDDAKLCKKLLPLVKQYGAAVVVGCIKDDLPVKAEQKLVIAQEAYDLIVNTYKIWSENIIFDPLVFPAATLEDKYRNAAAETIKAIRLIKTKFPGVKTVLGISNVSFGLPLAGREVLNSVFLHKTIEAGLDLAIVNTEKLVRYASISKEELRLCENILAENPTDLAVAITEFTAYFRQKQPETGIKKAVQDLSVAERLTLNILQGSKEDLQVSLDGALQEKTSLEVINQILMPAMDQVGEKFYKNELIVTEVLQSAEVMKAAIDYLDTFLAKEDQLKKGRLLLATVKGDVHDIGKNLVKIIFSSNGYDVLDLGINVPNQDILAACQTYQPTVIGLSGLLVKSAEQMVLVVQDLANAQISVPVMVGGAALSQRFVETKLVPQYFGKVLYCKDPLAGLMSLNK